MPQGLNDNDQDEGLVRTPDGREFKGASGGAGAYLAAMTGEVGRLLGLLAAATWKTIRTIWRLAEALDSALWRGLKLAVVSTAQFSAASARASAAAFAEVFRWLPSRSGRAYAAGSSVVLVLCALWAADEIRNARSDASALDSIFRPPLDLADPIVARVDGRFVHLSEIDAAARAGGQLQDGEKLTVEAAFSREMVSAFVEQRLLARAAIDEGLQRDPSVQRRLVAARDRILASSYMEDRVAAAVTPERIKRLYDSQVDVTRLGDEVKARHILVATEDEALAIVAELRAGGDFGAIARGRSLDRATAPLGGEVGWFTKDMMTPPFAAAAFSTPSGDIAEPFSTEFGWHVLQVLERRASGGVPFTAVEDNVKRFLTLRAVSQTLDTLKADDDVLYFPPETAEK
ncbi:MAG: peptidylprolyl isomerase [Pseudomonadota bacterium]